MKDNPTTAIALSSQQTEALAAAVVHVKEFCRKQSCTIGGAEIVLGSGLLALGIKTGAIEMGTRLVGLASGPFDLTALLAASGSGLPASAAGLVGGIGVAALGGAIGVPAGLLAAGGATVGFTTAYTVADIVHDLLSPGVDWTALIGGGSLLIVGVALILDGCQRVFSNESVKRMVSSLKDGVIYLGRVTGEVVCESAAALRNLAPFIQDAAIAVPVGAVCCAGGAAVGSAVATSSVTILGSHALGTAALSLGLVSAPLWPVIACAAGAAFLGGGAFWGARRLFR